MMKQNLYTIFDIAHKSVICAISPFPNDHVAKRNYATVSAPAAWQKFPNDFELVNIGVIDMDTGIIEPCKPVRVCLFTEILTYDGNDFQN